MKNLKDISKIQITKIKEESIIVIAQMKEINVKKIVNHFLMSILMKLA